MSEIWEFYGVYIHDLIVDDIFKITSTKRKNGQKWNVKI